MMTSENKKIISFLPSATEILYEIGCDSQIVGVTHECKYPEDAKTKPKVINSSFDASSMTSKEIDNKIVELFSKGTNIYVVNDKVLTDLKPDLIVAQGICEVCSPFTKEIKRAVSILGYNPDILILDPHNLKDILTNIMEISKKVDRVKEGQKLIEDLSEKINTVQKVTKIKDNTTLQRVLCLEWIDPFFTAGHWVPEMVEIAGGINGLSKAGEQSRRTTIEEIKDFNPDKIILMPCGFDTDRTLIEYKRTIKKDIEWNSLTAVKNGGIYAVDAGSYFSKPGPRTFSGLEILAKIIHPNDFNHITAPSNSFLRID
ncbi:MAG TPA: cobalamin-binding protein [Nitrososphaeraceae archaeon]|nr:cobalamin-binding protein [Nitrososphaeraceae archaeon]